MKTTRMIVSRGFSRRAESPVLGAMFGAVFCARPWPGARQSSRTAAARTFLTCSLLFFAASSTGAVSHPKTTHPTKPTPKAPAPFSASLTTKERAALVFDRLTFGPRPGDVETLERGGNKAIMAWIEAQLNPALIHDAQLDFKLKDLRPLHMSPSELLRTYLQPIDVAEKAGIPRDRFQKDDQLKEEYRAKVGEDNLPDRIVQEMVAVKLMRAVESNRQLEEVLTDFWFNHFNIEIGKNENKYLVPAYERDTIRAHLFGTFDELLKAVAHSPAMLVYLDNNVSESPLDYSHPGQPPKPRKQGLNENYAREILELHTLGVEGGYTQEDVTQLARILTGWSTDEMKTDPHFKYKDKVHDKGEKLFLETPFAAGHGEDEGDHALEMLAHHPSTAKFISLKLLRLFVGDNPPASLVEKTRARFVATGGNLKEVYRSIFTSPEFWSRATLDSKVKKPLFFVTSSVRALGGEVQLKTALPHILQILGEELYRCIPPTGYIDRAENWVNPGALVTRLNFTLDLTANRVQGVYVLLPHIENTPRTANELIDVEALALLHRPLATKTRQIVLRELGGESFLMADGEIRPWMLAKTTGLMLGSPDFQRR